MALSAARTSRTSSRMFRCGAALALLSATTGCVAVGAIPIAIGSALYVRNQARIRAATPVPGREVRAALPASSTAAADGAGGSPGVVLTDLTELPPPSGPMAPVASSAIGEEWQRFFSYALGARERLAGRDPAESALLASGSALTASDRRPCPKRIPAVVVDLDPDTTPFAPEQARPVPPELTEALQSLREAGIVILWIAQLPAARAADVAEALRVSGLDPEGRDELLLIRSGEDRKQVLREEANEDVCVIAIAGDRRADFDELFDYLRNPAGAAPLYPMMGSGWFLVPSLMPLSGEADR